MNIRVFETKYIASVYAAAIVETVIDAADCPVLGLATGSTPVSLYQELIRFHEQGLSFAEVTTVNLDEYVGLSPDHPQSYSFFMKDKLFHHIDIKAEQTFLPRGDATDLDEECKRYDSILRANLIDLQVLGIGANGHIGFNEPDSMLKTSTHVVELAPETIAANSRFFADKKSVPTRAITMGVQSILDAKQVILLAFGFEKARAVLSAVKGDVTSSIPASILHLHHNVTFVLDVEAASLLG
jgi:glucosamine-6-phosphate deaminase